MEGQITQVVLSLSGIVLLIVTLGFVVKRANKNGLMGVEAMRVVASLNLGVKEKLVLIEVGGEQLLIAAGASGISKIHVLKEPIPSGAGSIDKDVVSRSLSEAKMSDGPGVDESNENVQHTSTNFRHHFESFLKKT